MVNKGGFSSFIGELFTLQVKSTPLDNKFEKAKYFSKNIWCGYLSKERHVPRVFFMSHQHSPTSLYEYSRHIHTMGWQYKLMWNTTILDKSSLKFEGKTCFESAHHSRALGLWILNPNYKYKQHDVKDTRKMNKKQIMTTHPLSFHFRHQYGMDWISEKKETMEHPEDDKIEDIV